MDEFSGKVAVVTGAASGIGLALAERFAAEGMKVVLADVEAEPLAAAERSIRDQGGTALAIRTDVTKEADLERLADTAFAKWGRVNVLCNNAGVSSGALADGIWSVPMQDWDWVMGVNFTGVLHGVRHFVPRMLASGEPGHVVNTASAAGLVSATNGPYVVSKFGVVALTERLYKDLKLRDAKVSASVLCPGWVDTRILDSQRNRPEERMPNALAQPGLTARAEMIRKTVGELLKKGFRPSEIAGLVAEAIRKDTFYIVPVQPDIAGSIELRLEDIRLRRNPAVVPFG